jgi:protein-tyrosine-phosphatase
VLLGLQAAVAHTTAFRVILIVANRKHNVLFLCTGNSARSIMAECALNRWGADRFHAFSAGSHPNGVVHPLTIDLLNELGYQTRELRSKSWDEFDRPGGPHFDFVFTVCDRAAADPCPIWPGHPLTAHWGVPDPAALRGTEDEKRHAFARAYRELEDRIRTFANLNLETLGSGALKQRLEEIGQPKSSRGQRQ